MKVSKNKESHGFLLNTNDKLRSESQFGLQLNGQGVEVNFDLFRETFVQFDLNIDLFFYNSGNHMSC